MFTKAKEILKFRELLTLSFLALSFLIGTTNADDSKLIDDALKHPTSKILNEIPKGMSNEDLYSSKQSEILKTYGDFNSQKKSLFHHLLKEKEIASLRHQLDLIKAIERNNPLKKELLALGFDFKSYLRGSYDSDMGKLKAYQELYLLPSGKSSLLFSFLQGKAPQKSILALHEVLEKYGLPVRPFLNPELSHEKLRSLFLDFPILLGYLHEFPGMVDAVIAFEKGILSKKEFQNEILVNLGHSGPSAGYWNFLEKNLLPRAFERMKRRDELTLLFKGTLFEDGANGIPQYAKPTTFESYISTFFDRMGQATRGGYFKIDFEVDGNPITNVQSLLLENNNSNTQKQIKVLLQLLDSSKLGEKQKAFLKNLFLQGIKYLQRYSLEVKKYIHYRKEKGVETISLKKPLEKVTWKYSSKNSKYFINDQKYNKEKIRYALHTHIRNILYFLETPDRLGDPFSGNEWRK